MSTLAAEPKDVVALWKRVSARLQAMTPEEQGESLVKAGILTKKGNVAKRYKNVIIPVQADFAIMGNE